MQWEVQISLTDELLETAGLNLTMVQNMECPIEQLAWTLKVLNVTENGGGGKGGRLSTLRLQKGNSWASLMAQWLRILLQCPGHGFELWSGKVPHAAEQLSPCTITTKPAL